LIGVQRQLCTGCGINTNMNVGQEIVINQRHMSMYKSHDKKYIQ